nr:hypothetical protein [Tanacetum cinerariifolium]
CLRQYTIDAKGVEHMLKFSIENWWAGDRESLVTGQPSRQYIDALEDSDVLLFPKVDFEQFAREVPAFHAFIDGLLDRTYLASQRRVQTAISADAETKYREFVQTYPQLALRVAPVTASVASWQGRLVIDPTNPILLPGFRLAELGGQPSSEVVASLVSSAQVVKAFNTLTPAVLAANPRENGGQRVIFYSGNDKAAKATVAGLLQQMGFAGIDLGLLHEGGKLQQFPGGPLPTLNLLKVA